MTTLTLLSIICILSYTLAVCLKFKGIPNSISASFYSLEHKWWFRFTMWVTPFLLLPEILEASTETTQFLAFLAIVGMVVVGCFPDYVSDQFNKRGHTAGAIMCLVFSQLWVAFNGAWFLLPWLAYLVYTGVQMKRLWDGKFYTSFLKTNPMFWVEVFALLTTYMLLIFKPIH